MSRMARSRMTALSSFRLLRWLSLLFGVTGMSAWLLFQGAAPEAAPAESIWADEASCGACHQAALEAWRGSHHHLAMQQASEGTVLGVFDGQRLATESETSEFVREGARFTIYTGDSGGERSREQVVYTLGVDPLQQLLLQLPNGALQVHGAAWDVSVGRWFHLYEGQGVDSKHPLHWRRSQQNADFMCIECHSTGFQRRYDPARDLYESQWQGLGVGCQGCHGPAGAHLRWAAAEGEERSENLGFAAGHGHIPPAAQVQTCARCHSRRSPLGNAAIRARELMDDYLPALLHADLYEVDGKIQDEVFEYGSFLQSRMAAVGVICSDCHSPHSASLHQPGDAVCLQCHNKGARPIREAIESSGLHSKRYDDPSHHHHEAGGPGSRCVDCHMPGKVYMGNDLRHDHSFSSPLPEQALALGHSDPCLACHGEGERERVIEGFARWYPEAQPRDGGYARDLYAGRQGQPGAANALLRQLGRRELPDIRRATVLQELVAYPSELAALAVLAGLEHPSPLVRHSSIQAASSILSAPQQLRALTPRLQDPVRAVRLAASWQLLQLLADQGQDPERLAALIAEYEASQLAQQERAEAQTNLAAIFLATGREHQVEAALDRALRQNPDYFPAWLLLAQWKEERDPAEAGRILEEALLRNPQEASLHHAVALMQVRQGDRGGAVAALRRAHAHSDDPVYAFVLGVALYDSGEVVEARELLQRTLRRFPAERSIRLSLIAYLRAGGLWEEAETLVEEGLSLNPGDSALQRRPSPE